MATRLRRGGTSSRRSQFASKESVNRYAQRFGEQAAQDRFTQQTQQASSQRPPQSSSQGSPLGSQASQSMRPEAMWNSSSMRNQQPGSDSRPSSNYSQESSQNKVNEQQQKAQQQAYEAQQKKEQEEYRKQQQAQELERKREEIEAQTQEKIEKYKQKKDEAIENIKNGPHGIMKLFLNKYVLLFMGFIDALIGLIPVYGDLISFGINLFFWSIPCVLTMDVKSWIKIYVFLIIDLAIGFVPGYGDLADLAPEIIGTFMPIGPPNILANAYQSRIPHMVSRVNKKYDRKIKQAQEEKKSRLKNALKSIKGGIKDFVLDGQKLFFLLFFIGIAILRPFVINFLSFT